MINEKDFFWQTKRTNNIETNPEEYKYCVVDFGDGNGKIYQKTSKNTPSIATFVA